MTLRNVLVAGAILGVLAVIGVLVVQFTSRDPFMDVPVAAQDLEPGTTINIDQMFVIQPMRRSQVVSSGKDRIVYSAKDLDGQLLFRPLSKGEPCSGRHLQGFVVLVMASVKPESRAALRHNSTIALRFEPRHAEQKAEPFTAQIDDLQDYPGTDSAGLLLLVLLASENDAKRIGELVAKGQHTATVEAKGP